MSTHTWTEDIWEGTPTTGFRKISGPMCSGCRVLKNASTDKSHCMAAAFEYSRELRDKIRLAGQVRMLFPPQQIPDEELDKFEKRLLSPEGRTRVSMLLHERMRKPAQPEDSSAIGQVVDCLHSPVCASPPEEQGVTGDLILEVLNSRAADIAEAVDADLRKELADFKPHRFDIIEHDPIPPWEIGYKKDRPLDRALVVVHEHQCCVLGAIGPGLDQLASEYGLQPYFGEYTERDPPPVSGTYIWEGHLTWTKATPPDYDDSEIELVGEFRKATRKEWDAWCKGEHPWDPNEWKEPECLSISSTGHD